MRTEPWFEIQIAIPGAPDHWFDPFAADPHGRFWATHEAVVAELPTMFRVPCRARIFKFWYSPEPDMPGHYRVNVEHDNQTYDAGPAA